MNPFSVIVTFFKLYDQLLQVNDTEVSILSLELSLLSIEARSLRLHLAVRLLIQVMQRGIRETKV